MTNDPLYFRPYLPGHVIVRTPIFVTLCALAVLGSITLLLILVGV